jgi:hypothetical protein
MPFNPTGMESKLVAAFSGGGSASEADAITKIAAAIADYFSGVILPAPGSGLVASMTSAAESALAGMNASGALAAKLSSAVMDAAGEIETAGSANSPVTSPPTYDFSTMRSAEEVAAYITTTTDTTTATWQLTIPSATPTPWT